MPPVDAMVAALVTLLVVVEPVALTPAFLGIGRSSWRHA